MTTQQIKKQIERRDILADQLKQADAALLGLAKEYATEHGMKCFFVEHLRRAVQYGTVA